MAAATLHVMTGVTIDRFAPGTRVGDYQIEHPLPSKRAELAFQAIHVVLPRRVRLVISNPAFVGGRPAAVRLLREACILEGLHHTGITRVFECGVVDRSPWVAMELVEGTTLADAIEHVPATVLDVVALLGAVAAILDHAHQHGVVHCNLHPAAIVDRGERRSVLAWSQARVHDAVVPRVASSAAVDYAAPELESGTFDGRADIYSLGTIAYRALTGDLPTLSARRRCPTAPAELTALIDRMLAVDPVQRPTADDVCCEIRHLATASTPPTPDAADTEEIEQVELVDLVELEQPDPAQRPRSIRWTPPLGMASAVPIPVVSSQLGTPGRGRR